MVDDIAAGLAALKVTDNIGAAIDEAIARLHETYKGEKIPLRALEAELAALRTAGGVSMKQFTKHVKARGICLGNCAVLGSMHALRVFLRTHQNMIVRRKKAKQYKHVKQCLIILYN
jgi:hypothetical protein